MLHKFVVLADEELCAWLENQAAILGWTPSALLRRIILDRTELPNGIVVKDKGLVLEIDELCPETSDGEPEHMGEWETFP